MQFELRKISAIEWTETLELFEQIPFAKFKAA